MNLLKPTLARTDADIPPYVPQGNECSLFETALVRQLPLLLKGPTGCGKTRFVSHMAARLGLPLTTVSCHDDLAAAVEDVERRTDLSPAQTRALVRAAVEARYTLPD